MTYTGIIYFNETQIRSYNSLRSEYDIVKFELGNKISQENLKFVRLDSGSDSDLLITDSVYTFTVKFFPFNNDSFSTVNTILNSDGEFFTSISDNFVSYEIDQDFSKDNDYYKYRITIADGTNNINLSNLSNDDIVLPDGTLSRKWNGTVKNTLTISDGNQKVFVTDYFNSGSGGIKLNGESLPAELDVTLDDTTNVYEFTDFVDVVHGTGKVSASDIGVAGADKDRITGTATLSRINSGNLLYGDIEIIDFDFDKATKNININGDLTSVESTKINVTLNADLTDHAYKASVYKEDITILADGVELSNLKSGDILNVEADTKYIRDFSVISGNSLILEKNDVVSVTVTDYNTNNSFTLNDGAESRELIVINATDFDATTDGWGFNTFNITGSGTLKGGDDTDTITASSSGSVIYGNKGNDIITGGAGVDEIHVKAGDGTDTLSNISAADKIYVDIENADIRVVKADANLLRIYYNGETVSDRIDIEDFKFADRSMDLSIYIKNGNGYTEPKTIYDYLTVYVEPENSYDASSVAYKQDITVNGDLDITNLSGKDNLNIDSDYELSRLASNPNVLTINYGDNAVNVLDFDYTAAPKFSIDNTPVAAELIVNIDENYNANENYKEVFIAGGEDYTIYGYDYNNDAVYTENIDETKYTRINNGDLTVNGLKIDSFDFSDNNYITVTDGENTKVASDMNIDVELTDGAHYVTTKFVETISGNGSVSNLGTDDIIKMNGEVKFTISNDGLNISTDNENSITVSDYVSGKELTVYNGNALVDTLEHTLYVSGKDGFDASKSDFKFKDINVKGTNSESTYKGTSKSDVFVAGSAGDTIYGGDGVDTITGGAGNDIIYGGDGADIINGMEGNDEIYTGLGDDKITATSGANTIYIDGAGTKYITSGSEAGNTFKFSKGSSEIVNATSADKIAFATFNPEMFAFSKEGKDLVISSTVVGASDKISIKGYFDDEGQVVEDAIKTFVLDKTEITMNIQWINGQIYNVINSNDTTINGLWGITNLIEAGNSSNIIKGGDYEDVVCGNGGSDTIYTYGSADINGGSGNDKIITYGGGNTVCFINTDNDSETNEYLFGSDTIEGLTSTDKLKFSLDKGGGVFAGYQESELSLSRDGVDLIISAKKKDTANINSVTLTDYFAQEEKDRVDAVIVLNDNVEEEISLSDLVDSQIYDSKQTSEDVSDKNTITGSTGNDHVDVSDFISSNGKGVSINTQSGDDTVVGSDYNDTIKSSSLAGQSTDITEYAGTNKITTGAGDDAIFAYGYSGNTINVGAGNNKVVLNSIGNNKVNDKNGNNEIAINSGSNTVTLGNGKNKADITAGSNTLKLGKGNNDVNIYGGVNTVKAGNGENDLIIIDGVNTVSTGKKQDNFIIQAGNNNIKSSTGNDIYNIVGGYNTIKTGNADTTFNISEKYDLKDESGDIVTHFENDGGLNVITSGSQKDTFTISAGNNTINSGSGVDTFYIGYEYDDEGNRIKSENGGTNIINAGKGNDVFDINSGINYLNGAGNNDIYNVASDFIFGDEGKIVISDASGKNELNYVVDDKINIYFDVEVKTNKKGTKCTGAKYGEMTFSTDTTVTDFDLVAGIDVSGKKSISKLNDTNIKSADIDKLANEIAKWIFSQNTEMVSFDSASDILSGGTDAQKTTLIGMYQQFANDGYRYDGSHYPVV